MTSNLSSDRLGQLAAKIAYVALDEGVDADTLMAAWSVLGVLMPLAVGLVADVREAMADAITADLKKKCL